MADNVQRALQNLDLGINDVPVALPIEVVNQAVAENRFIIIGRPVIPRRQNLRSIVAALPRQWGQGGLVHGQIIAGGRFQFVFPSEESMENILRCGMWAFADHMIILQRWSPMFNYLMLNFIPFWIQIRRIPLQFMNHDVVAHTGRALGQLMDVDYHAESAVYVEYVWVKINWDVNLPLRFQKNFQFTSGVNTLLKFRYERLRGLCETCGLLTHDSGNCLIQNGDMDKDSDGDEEDDMAPQGAPFPNHGVEIHEIVEGEQDEEAADQNGTEKHDGAADEDLYYEEPLGNMYSEDWKPVSYLIRFQSSPTPPETFQEMMQDQKCFQVNVDPAVNMLTIYQAHVEEDAESRQARKRKGKAIAEGKPLKLHKEKGKSSGSSTDQNNGGAVGPNSPPVP